MRQLTPNQLQKFSICLPRETHWSAAPCDDVDCDHYLYGWQTIVSSDSMQASYIRKLNTNSVGPALRRQFREEAGENGMAIFTFPPGQRCFREHQAPNGREPIFLRKTTEGQQLLRKQDFPDAMNEQTHKFKRLQEQG